MFGLVGPNSNMIGTSPLHETLAWFQLGLNMAALNHTHTHGHMPHTPTVRPCEHAGCVTKPARFGLAPVLVVVVSISIGVMASVVEMHRCGGGGIYVLPTKGVC